MSRIASTTDVFHAVADSNRRRMLDFLSQGEAPVAVDWACVKHSRLSDWAGTRVLFGLAARGAEGSELTFRHIGLTPSLECFGQCERGWDHFLASLVSYVDRGEGTPFRGSESRR